ncbi:MAG: hypothetical protein KA974_10990 [Saprospiraceae bacterium]|nr:hypothetical protein [Saprospiraceae bacterium]
MKYTFFIICLFLFVTNIYSQSFSECKRQPQFIRTLEGFDPSKAALSTSEIRKMGLVLVQLDNIENERSERKKTYQHPSWQSAGWLGGICIDEFGNTYTIPAPMVNVLNNPQQDQNIIYKVETKTGVMSEFINLPHQAHTNDYNTSNPYGMLGIAYDCENHCIYATSVFGSDSEQEIGMIYQIDVQQKKVLSTFKNYDAFGITTGNFSGEKRLYFGHARSGNILSLALDKNGNIIGEPRFEFSIDGIGLRGDDRVRRLRVTPDGELVAHGIEFYYNLTAPSEKQESIYKFRFEKAKQIWIQTQ